MLQWLQSKIALIVAGLILISSLSTIFYIQVSSMERDELKERCRKISGVIEHIDNIDADLVRKRISFEEDSKGIFVDPEIKSGSYMVEISEDFVELKSESDSVRSDLTADIHLWEPEELNRTGDVDVDDLNKRDSLTEPLIFEAGEGDILIRKLRLSHDRSYRSHIFISRVDDV